MPDERFFEPEIETMPRASLAALQEERILELVPYVYERSALVRRKWEEARVKPSDINAGPRAHQVREAALGLRGTLTQGPCACGRAGQRVTISEGA
jgi:hypothetical protein